MPPEEDRQEPPGHAEQRKRVEEMLGQVGLPVSALDRYPHEFSGGRRQRLGFARALILSPELIVADEPVSALDVSIQAQVLNLMRDLQRELGLTYMFISHDLSVVRYLSTRIGVMYLGKLVEIGPADEVYLTPAHPYTRGLIDSAPVADPLTEQAKEERGVRGELPSAIHLPSGCWFRTWCPLAPGDLRRGGAADELVQHERARGRLPLPAPAGHSGERFGCGGQLIERGSAAPELNHGLS